MKVVLTEDVYKHGVAGEVVDVADGYARNYLIPQRLAVKATPGALKQYEQLRVGANARKAALENKLNELAKQIDGTEIVFGRRAGSNGKLYGSVTTMDIVDALRDKIGVEIDRRRISQQSLRELGEHEINVRIGSDEIPTITAYIVREEELDDFLAAREAGETPDFEEDGEIDWEIEEAPELAGDQLQEIIDETEANTQTLEPTEEETETA